MCFATFTGKCSDERFRTAQLLHSFIRSGAQKCNAHAIVKFSCGLFRSNHLSPEPGQSAKTCSPSLLSTCRHRRHRLRPTRQIESRVVVPRDRKPCRASRHRGQLLAPSPDSAKTKLCRIDNSFSNWPSGVAPLAVTSAY